MDRWGPKHVELTYVMNKTYSLKTLCILLDCIYIKSGMFIDKSTAAQLISFLTLFRTRKLIAVFKVTHTSPCLESDKSSQRFHVIPFNIPTAIFA